jgi:hypothetical protein
MRGIVFKKNGWEYTLTTDFYAGSMVIKEREIGDSEGKLGEFTIYSIKTPRHPSSLQKAGIDVKYWNKETERIVPKYSDSEEAVREFQQLSQKLQAPLITRPQE